MEALRTWLQDTDPGALFALGFVVLVVLLSIYALRHWAKRKAALLEMMPKLGFQAIEEPDPERLVPDSLFHPNGFGEQSTGRGTVQDVMRRVPMAWTGRLADRDVTVMDVSVMRRRTGQTEDRDQTHPLNRTVLRCPTPTGEPPPDLLIEERVLFKGQVKDQRSVRGNETFGEHYFLFSSAPDTWLERWITPPLEDVLGRHRLWRLAAHDGVLYLCRGSSREEPKEMESFLHEGEEFLRAFLP
ncbi:MAG: hypothetical protein MPN21_27285 [Thermoanaerobaculia bacterium]|nr:hypothetical protein [Thermoanaerobaculia bacterium]